MSTTITKIGLVFAYICGMETGIQTGFLRIFQEQIIGRVQLQETIVMEAINGQKVPLGVGVEDNLATFMQMEPNPLGIQSVIA